MDDPFNDHSDDNDDFHEDTGPSKSQRKRDAHKLLDLGAEIAGLTNSQRAQLPIDPELSEAITLYNRIRQHGGKKRQLLFIGKLLRQRDNAELIEALDRLRNVSASAKREHHQLEQWRDEMIAGNDARIESVIEQFPQVDRQQLRALVRQARTEALQSKPPAAARKLFRFLRELLTKDAP